jgi:hypothetical protein
VTVSIDLGAFRNITSGAWFDPDTEEQIVQGASGGNWFDKQPITSSVTVAPGEITVKGELPVLSIRAEPCGRAPIGPDFARFKCGPLAGGPGPAV